MLQVLRLDLADARALVDIAREESVRVGVPMCIAVTDEAGDLIAFDRMDGAKISSISIAIDKAFTGGAARRPTSHYNQAAASGQKGFGLNTTNGGRFSTIPGGCPIFHGDVVVGGIGISGGTPDEDLEVAEAAVRRFEPRSG